MGLDDNESARSSFAQDHLSTLHVLPNHKRPQLGVVHESPHVGYTMPTPIQYSRPISRSMPRVRPCMKSRAFTRNEAIPSQSLQLFLSSALPTAQSRIHLDADCVRPDPNLACQDSNIEALHRISFLVVLGYHKYRNIISIVTYSVLSPAVDLSQIRHAAK